MSTIRTGRSGSAESTRAALRAPVMEVFASIQGEGLYAGEPQVLLRLSGCPLRCRWCDTPGSWALPGDGARARVTRARVPKTGAEPRGEPPWATPFQAATWIAAVDRGGKRPVSVTGGEPLVWPGFVAELARYLGPRRVHLETAGGHPDALARVVDAVDHVSLDLKLPADLDPPVPLAASAPRAADAADAADALGERAAPSDEPAPRTALAWAEARAEALELVRGRDACAKLVVAGGRAAADFRPLVDDLAAIAPEVPLFVQPVTPAGGVAAPAREELLAVADLALARGLTVRVVPQLHRVLRLP